MARSAFQAYITNPDDGGVLDGAQVTVALESGDPLTIYEQQSGGSAKANPFTVGSDGKAVFYAEPGIYRITATQGGITSEFRYYELGTAKQPEQFLQDFGGLSFESIAPLTKGGTGGTTAEEARDNLDVYRKRESVRSLPDITSLSSLSTAALVDGQQFSVKDGDKIRLFAWNAGTESFDELPVVTDTDNVTGAGTAITRDTGTEMDQVPLNTNIVYPLTDITALGALNTTALMDGQQFRLGQWWPNSQLGGFSPFWDSTRSKADHNGITVIDPTQISKINTTTKTFNGYHTADGAGQGCFVWEPNGVATMYQIGGFSGVTTIDHGALLNGIRHPDTVKRLSHIWIENGQWYVSTSIKRYAGTIVEGENRAYTILYNDTRACNGLEPSGESELNFEGEILSNGTGTYYGATRNVTFDNFDIGLYSAEDWWHLIDECTVSNCATGQKVGYGTSNTTGAYWSRTVGTRFKGNDINLIITDFTNLNKWERCRFEGASIGDVQLIEPTNPLGLGLENNAFEQCEFTSPNSVELRASILGLTFDQCYFETAGTSVFDSNSTKNARNVVFKECGFYGGASTANKVKLGYGASGSCTHVKFDNCISNIGRGAGAPTPLYVYDMGPNAFWWTIDNQYEQHGADVKLISPESTNKDKWQLRAENKRSIEFFNLVNAKKTLSELSITVPTGIALGADVRGQVASIVKDLGVMPTDGSYVEVFRIPRFFIASAYSFANIKATFSARNLTNPGQANAYREVDVGANGTSMDGPTTINTRDYGAVTFVFDARTRVDGDELVFEVQAGAPGDDDLDQASVSCVVSANGRIIRDLFLA